MTSIRADEVKAGMYLERLDYVGDSSSPGKPRYIRAAVVSIEPERLFTDDEQPPWQHIVWAGGARGVYAPHQRFIVVTATPER